MAIIWTKDLTVGVDIIDEQHKELIQRINYLVDACHQGKGAEAVGEVLDFLAQYVYHHFSTEEGIMEQHNYPSIDEHRQQHQELIANLAEIRRRFQKDGPGVHIVVMTNRLLAAWLLKHIRRSDKALGAYINA